MVTYPWVMDMKRRIKEALAAIFLGAVVPMIFFRIAESRLTSPTGEPPSTELQTIPTAQNTQKTPTWIAVLCDEGAVQQMPIEDYLTGVLLGEMPAEFEPEALKAQAVVARTYALKRSSAGNKHPQNAVCTNSACCQAYCTVETFLKSGGTAAHLEKIQNAVKVTDQQVLTYNGALIEATYFSCSGGKTEDAQAVWGAQIPYLQSVESPGEENATHYIDTVTFTAEEFCALLDRQLPGAPAGWIGSVTYTAGGGVDVIRIGGQEYQGTHLRQLLGLRSTAFVITAAGDTVTITTKGFGHRVGMSQYGAEAMAVSGSTYDQILSHYYPGTVLQTWPDH